MSANFNSTSYEPIDAGVYPARLDSIESGTSETYGEFRRWNFTIKRPDGTFDRITAVSSMASGPKSKGYKWAAALLGRNPKAGENVDLTGKQCQLHVIVNDDGFNRIEAVLPPANGNGGSTAAPAAPTKPQDPSVGGSFEDTVEMRQPDPQDAPLPF